MKNELAILVISALTFGSAFAAGKKQTIGLFENEPDAYQGYTLFSPIHYNGTYLIDMEGRQVHSWEADKDVSHAMLLENGLLLRALKSKPKAFARLPMVHGILEMVDWDGDVVWDFAYATGRHVLHHDFMVMPNGNILAVSYDLITKKEAIAQGRMPDTIPAEGLVADRIIEIKPDLKNGGGEIVWSWSTWDHLIQDFDISKPNYGKVADHPERFDPNYFRNPQRTRDWNHVNGIDYNAELDAIIVTVHINDEFVIIDHSTTAEESASSLGGNYAQGGDILYRFGNPGAYRAGSRQDSHYKALHNAHWIPAGQPGAGNVMVLNNHFNGQNSTLEVLKIPYTDNGRFDLTTPAKPTTVFSDFHTANMGGGQRLPNGNTLINESVKGRILEVTPGGNVVWSYVIPVADHGPLAQGEAVPVNPRNDDWLNEYFLAYRYAADHPALAGKDLTAKGVIEKPAGTITQKKESTSPRKGPGQQGAGRRTGPSRPSDSFIPGGLTGEQQAAYAAVIAESNKKKKQAFKRARGDRQEMGKAITAITEEQTRLIKKILTDDQFEEYSTWMDAQKRPRGDR